LETPARVGGLFCADDSIALRLADQFAHGRQTNVHGGGAQLLLQPLQNWPGLAIRWFLLI
jgi:hypothetical protein